MEQLNDHAILSGCISGDRRAKDAFVRRFSGLVYRTAQGTLRAKNLPYNNLDLEDLHNTVFVALFEKGCKKLRQYKGKNGCTIASWLRLITVRTVLDHIRKSRCDVLTRQEKIQPLDLIANVEGERPEQWTLMENAERTRLVEEGLRALMPRDRLFLKLHCMEGLSIREVAGILKVSEGNAHSIKHRAIERLRAKMAQ